MSRLTTPQRIGLLLTGILLLLAAILLAILPAPRATNLSHQSTPADTLPKTPNSSLLTPNSQAKKAPTPAPPPRNFLDEDVTAP